MAAGSWAMDAQWTNVVHTTLGNRMLIPEATLPSATMNFFRMVKSSP
jgi:hypothetical protein